MEFANNIGGQSDSEMANLLLNSLKKQGIKFRLGTGVTKSEIKGDKVILTVESVKGMHLCYGWIV